MALENKKPEQEEIY